jgi:S1-C subfamily serine protease
LIVDARWLRKFPARIDTLDRRARALVHRLAPRDDEIMHLLARPNRQGLLSRLEGLSMMAFAGEVFAAVRDLEAIRKEWYDLEAALHAFLRGAEMVSGPRTPAALFVHRHEARDYRGAEGVWKAFLAEDMVPSSSLIERYLDFLARLGRKDDYQAQLARYARLKKFLFGGPGTDFARLCREATNSVGWVNASQTASSTATGTGFLVSPNLLVTCRHVVEEVGTRKLLAPERMRVVCPDSDSARTADPEVIEVIDPFQGDLDAVILRLSHRREAYFRLGYSGLCHRGDKVWVLGFPLPDQERSTEENLEFHSGPINGFETMIPWLIGAFKIDVEAGPGMSGAPVCNESGEVIGICTLQRSIPLGADPSRSGIIIERFAQLVDAVRDVLGSLGEAASDGSSVSSIERPGSTDFPR